MQLSKNFSLNEMTYSTTANKYKINNNPDTKTIENLRLLCIKALQPIRDKFGIVTITSGYRCLDLNKKVGGKTTSQHLKGQAVDFITPHANLLEVFDWIVENLEYDQVLFEYNSKCSKWIHLSLKKTENRKYNNRNYKV